MKKKYVSEKGHFLMGIKEAQNLFSKVGSLSIVKVKGSEPALRLENKKSGWDSYFWKGIPGTLKTTFCDMETAHYIAKELGFKPRYNTEVTMFLVGKGSVMVKVYDTNTRPEGFTESDSIENALELGFELGKNKNKYYLKKNGEYFKEGKVIKSEYLRSIFLVDHDPAWWDQWEVRIKKITLSKVICRCTYVADYSIFLDKD